MLLWPCTGLPIITHFKPQDYVSQFIPTIYDVQLPVEWLEVGVVCINNTYASTMKTTSSMAVLPGEAKLLFGEILEVNYPPLIQS